MSKRHRWRQRQQEQRQEQEQEQSKDAEGPFWWWEEVEKQRRRSGEGPRGFGNFGGGDSHWWDWEEGRWQKRGGKDESKRPYREEWDQVVEWFFFFFVPARHLFPIEFLYLNLCLIY